MSDPAAPRDSSHSALILVESTPACDRIVSDATHSQYPDFSSLLRAAATTSFLRTPSSGSVPVPPPTDDPTSSVDDGTADVEGLAPAAPPPPAAPPDFSFFPRADTAVTQSSATSQPPLAVRVHRRRDLFPMHPGAATEHLADSVRRASTNRITDRGRSVDTYDAYRQALDVVSYPSALEFFNQPVVVVVAAWVGEEDTVAAMEALGNPAADELPPAFRDGFLDLRAGALVYVLLARSGSEEDRQQASEAVSRAREVFGSSAPQLVVVEGRPDHVPSDDSETVVKDQISVETLADDLVHRVVRDQVEAQTNELYALVDKAKRGVKNTFKSWFKSSAPERNKSGPLENAEADHAKENLFTSDSIEARIRALADNFFLLGDHEQALAHYRLVAHDFKAAGALLHHASASEMAGVCLTRMKGSRREVSSAFDAASESYALAGASRAVVRSTMRLVDFCLENALNDMAVSVLLRGVATLSRRAKLETVDWLLSVAVLLHKTSVIYLLPPVRKLRKSALYSFFAAERYSSAGLYEIALHCYEDVTLGSENSGFDYLNDHLRSAVGRAYVGHGDRNAAFHNFRRLLRETRQPATFQLDFLRPLTKILQGPYGSNGHSKSFVADFPLIDDDSVHVFTRDAVAPPGSNKESWKELEDRLLMSSASSASGSQGLFSDRALSKTTRFNPPGTAVAGEAFFVSVVFTNPLSLSFDLVEVQVDVVDESSTPDNVPVRCVEMGVVTLEERSRGLVCLGVQPSKTGVFRVVGFKWHLEWEVEGERCRCECYHSIARKGQRLNGSRKERCSSVPLYGSENSLQIFVSDTVGCLEAELDLRLSQSFAREGEVWEGAVVLRNVAPMDIEDLKIVSNNPETLSLTFENDLVGEERENTLISLPKQTRKTLPCRVRAPSIGRSQTIQLRMVFGHCCPVLLPDGTRTRRWRVCRVQQPLEVRPCVVAFPRFLRFNPFVQSSERKEYLLGVELEHAWTEGGEKYRITGIGVLCSPLWTVEGVGDAIVPTGCRDDTADPGALVLYVNETATVFVRLAKRALDDDSDIAVEKEFMELRLGPDGGTTHILAGSERLKFIRAEHRNVSSHRDSMWVIAFWREELTGASGELYLPSLVPSEWVDEKDPDMVLSQNLSGLPTARHILRVSFEHEEEVDLGMGGLPLSVPVSIIIHNESEFVVDARFSTGVSGIADKSRGRLWSEDVSVRIRHMAPGAFRRINTAVVVTRPGLYDISDVSLEPVASKTGSGYVHNQSNLFATIEKRCLLVHRGRDRKRPSSLEGLGSSRERE